jgi:hypothetical protein
VQTLHYYECTIPLFENNFFSTTTGSSSMVGIVIWFIPFWNTENFRNQVTMVEKLGSKLVEVWPFASYLRNYFFH